MFINEKISKKIYYQKLYKDIWNDIEEIDKNNVGSDFIKNVIKKINLLNKEKKKKTLVNKLKQNKNFMTYFYFHFKDEVESLL